MVSIKDIPVEEQLKIVRKVMSVLPFYVDAACGEGCDSCVRSFFEDLASDLDTFATSHNLPREHAADLVRTLGIISILIFGREFETRYIEGFPGEAVIRLTECPMLHRADERGFAHSRASVLCSAYVQSIIKALNSRYQIRISRAMCRGDNFCEMIIEPKKDT